MKHPTNGIVAFLDIMGYASLIDNAQIDETAWIIANLLKPLPQETVGILNRAVLQGSGMNSAQAHSEFLESGHHLIFSDTILLAFPLPYTEDPAVFMSWLTTFFAYVSLLLRRSFDAGLPLRGAIALGPFVVDEYCIAGKAIIDAYRLGQRLEMAGCALEDETARAVSGALNHILDADLRERMTQPLRRLLWMNDLPVKAGVERTFAVRWVDPFDEWGLVPNDLAAYVRGSFTAHKKSLTGSANSKLENTIKMLEACRLTSRYPPSDAGSEHK